MRAPRTVRRAAWHGGTLYVVRGLVHRSGSFPYRMIAPTRCMSAVRAARSMRRAASAGARRRRRPTAAPMRPSWHRPATRGLVGAHAWRKGLFCCLLAGLTALSAAARIGAKKMVKLLIEVVAAVCTCNGIANNRATCCAANRAAVAATQARNHGGQANARCQYATCAVIRANTEMTTAGRHDSLQYVYDMRKQTWSVPRTCAASSVRAAFKSAAPMVLRVRIRVLILRIRQEQYW